MLKIEPLLDRKPAKLSGGERQRVAIGRAIVRDPRAYLFDEPLSALDALLRLEMRSELKYLQRDLNRTLVYVTHDQVEAMSMADRMAVLRDGAVQQVATPRGHLPPARQPLRGHDDRQPADELPAGHGAAEQWLASWSSTRASRCGSQAIARARGRRGVLRRRAARGRACRRWRRDASRATVFVTEPLGGETVVDLHLVDRVVKALAPPTDRFSADEPVRIAFDPRRLHVFGADGEALASAAAKTFSSSAHRRAEAATRRSRDRSRGAPALIRIDGRQTFGSPARRSRKVLQAHVARRSIRTARGSPARQSARRRARGGSAFVDRLAGAHRRHGSPGQRADARPRDRRGGAPRLPAERDGAQSQDRVGRRHRHARAVAAQPVLEPDDARRGAARLGARARRAGGRGHGRRGDREGLRAAGRAGAHRRADRDERERSQLAARRA